MTTGPVLPPLPPDLQSLTEQLRVEFGAERRGLPRAPIEVQDLQDRDLLVFLSERRRYPVGGMDADTREALRRYVAGGGRLLLLGFAARLVHEIGIEPVAPDRFATYRWGDSSATARGEYRFGLRVTDAGLTDLVKDMRGSGGAFLLGGGLLARVQSCYWENVDPERGLVLGRLSRVRDGESADLRAAVLTAWSYEKGRVLAYGSLPEPWRADADVLHNANQFLRNAVHSLCGGKPGKVTLCVEGEPLLANIDRMPAIGQRRAPAMTPVPHWGWQVPLQFQRDGLAAAEPKEVLALLEPAARAGASLLDIVPTDRDGGYPFVWTEADAIQKPASYWGGGYKTSWNSKAFADVASAAHERGMLVQASLSPDPVRGASATDMLSGLRFVGRELLDLRRLGSGAFDGCGVARWWQDHEGRSRDSVIPYQPAFHGYGADHLLGGFPGFAATIDADFGRPKGLSGCGISAQWRRTFSARLYAAAILDCRARRPLERLWGDQTVGGGSYGDWIVTQVNDFARQRLGPDGHGTGAAMWWRANNGATLGPHTVEYVQGVSQVPLRAAVAGRLLATGQKGFRELQRGFDKLVQPGFGAESEYAAHQPFLQNNHLRLHGSAGDLLFDVSGLARFRAGDPQRRVLARGLLRSVWRGLRPTVAEVEGGRINFLAGTPRGEGGYGTRVVVDQKELAGKFPAMLSHDEPGTWPRQVQVAWLSPRGQYELLLRLRAVDGRGILELRREGEVVRLLGFAAGEGTREYRIPFPIAAQAQAQAAEAGSKARFRMTLKVVDGGKVAVQACELARQGSMAVAAAVPNEVRIGDRAGYRASLVEHSYSPMFTEQKTLTVLADWPGFVLSIDYGNVAAGLQVQRSIGLTQHKLPRDLPWREAQFLRQPFVLTAPDSTVPDLLVLPLHLPNRHYLRVTEKGGLQLNGAPRSNERVQVAFLWMRDLPDTRFGEAIKIFKDLLDPRRLQIGKDGAAVVQPIAGVTLPHPRVLKITNLSRKPYLVQEAGAWSWRGSQPAAQGEWLMVYHLDGQPVQLHTGVRLQQGSRPAPGSLHSMRLRDRKPDGVTVELLQAGPFLAAPGVVFPQPFSRVSLDGKPWRYTHERTVYLPRRPGTYRIEIDPRPAGVVEASTRATQPALARTGAHVQSCRYDEEARVLELFTTGDKSLAQVGWFTNGTPTRVDGGELVGADSLGYDERMRQAAETAGVLIRFHPGLLRIHYR